MRHWTRHYRKYNTKKHAVAAHNDYDIVFRLLGKNFYEPFVQKRNEILASM